MTHNRRHDWWPFEDDADRDDPLTTRRIAVTSSHPRFCYLVGFDRQSQERPTDAEAAMLESCLAEYKHHWYNTSYLAQLASRALDVDSGANGVVFHKWGTDNWGYRRSSWTRGPLFVPGPTQDYRDRFAGGLAAFPLAALMDRIHTTGNEAPWARWVEWTATHPEAFPADVRSARVPSEAP